MKKRAILVILDSVGAGEAPDAYLFGDVGANTIGHVARDYDLKIPELEKLGLGHIDGLHLEKRTDAKGAYGKMQEKSMGKDTTTGHWEITGIELKQAFPSFPNGFPEAFIKRFEEKIGRKTIGNKVASGTVILDELGEEHIKTGYPIVYTSADSVFQIACHEDVIPLPELYAMCQTAREMLTGDLAVGRVIARPFIGEKAGSFKRTGGRRDYSLLPPARTVLDALKEAGKDVLAVGKIEDIFANQGITESNHAAGNTACIKAMFDYLERDFDGLLFVNLVDFDMIYGHRRDVEGYAKALEEFDAVLPRIKDSMHEQDILFISADHGCDPTFKGTDHTREYVPILAWHKGMERAIPLGIRHGFADLAATISHYFDLKDRFGAKSFLEELYQ